MAYLDDKRNPYTDSHPLDELDRELADLKNALGKLEADKPLPQTPAPVEQAPEAPAKKLPEAPDKPVSEPVPENPKATDEISQEEVTMQSAPKKPKNRTPLVIILVILTAVLLTAIGVGVLRILHTSGDTGSTVPTSGGEVVTINDSVMGDIELQTVEGAEINTYTEDNLSTDENGFYTYYENGKKISYTGIDLSSYQGDVDFNAVKNSGIEFVMLRIGGRYYGDDGGVYEDTAFDTFYQQAKAAGLKVGVYFFSQAASPEDAVEEAQFTINKLKNKQLDYPVAFDWENIPDDEARTDNVTGDQLTDIAEAFCDTIENAGYKSIIYANTHQMFIMYDFETMKDYDFWLADYRDFPTMYYNYDMWQYASDGVINGVEGNVDLNISFTDFSDKQEKATERD